MYTELKLDRIVATIAQLQRRIGERFPESGLSNVAAELHRLGSDQEHLLLRMRRPIWILRIGAALGIAGLLLIVALLGTVAFRVSTHVQSITDLLQASESAINDVVVLSLAIFFFLSLETRVKRTRALRALHKLRSIVHIVDMHQLTKDPEHVVAPQRATASSPKRTFTRFELSRYLDYCSELLSLASKLAAVYVQYLNDTVVLDAVNDIETLASTLSNKIWQKIMILDAAFVAQEER
ncbi:MAG TPA: hypothetical protein VLN59_13420 [Burkholderiales bacterium]|nr:hypothetical protein [Burkholderiales bacterium]